MLNELGRYVNYHRLTLKPYPLIAPQSELKDVMDPIHDLVKADHKDDGERAIQIRNKGTASVRIADMHKTKDCYILLLQYCDTKASNPVFKGLTRRQIRIAGRKEGEGIATSAHVIIRREELSLGLYGVALEQVPGLGSTSVHRFLTHMFKQASEGFSYLTKEGKERHYRPIAQLDLEPSDTLLEGLRKGRLLEIAQITQKTELGFDEQAYVVETEHVVRSKVDRSTNVTEQLQLLNRFRRKAREEQATKLVASIRINGKTQGVEVPMDIQDAGATLFARYDYLEVTSPLNQCSDSIRKDLSEPMATKLTSLHAPAS